MKQAVASPCILVCQLDRKTGWCLGCGRNSDEIMDWSSAPDELKRLILGLLPERLEAMGLPPGGDGAEAERRAVSQRSPSRNG